MFLVYGVHPITIILKDRILHRIYTKIERDLRMKKILIVEDEHLFLKLLNSQLTKKGYLVYQAVNGKEGFAKAKIENPDLILLDIKMQVMDGMTMLDLLRRDKICKKTKVIILTNIEPDENIIKKVIKNKPLYYFIKSDIKLFDLLGKIDQLFPI